MAETLKKGSRVTGAARDKLAADLKKKYDSGASIRALAEETGRSYGFVHRMLSESGVTLRGRGGATRRQEGRCGLTAGSGPGRVYVRPRGSPEHRVATRPTTRSSGWLLFSSATCQ